MPPPPSYHVNQVGARFPGVLIDENSAAIDVSMAQLVQLIFRRPDGSVLTVNAALTNGGTDGAIEYRSVAGDLNVAGTWRYQVRARIDANNDFRSDEVIFAVLPNL